MPDHAALLAHIVSQTRQNVEFLVAQGELSRPDGNAILNKLPTANDISVRELSDSTRRMALPQAPAAPSMPVVNNVRSPPPPQPPTTTARRIQQAKAIWAYNEDGSVSINCISPFLFCRSLYSTRNLTISPSGLVM